MHVNVTQYNSTEIQTASTKIIIKCWLGQTRGIYIVADVYFLIPENPFYTAVTAGVWGVASARVWQRDPG